MALPSPLRLAWLKSPGRSGSSSAAASSANSLAAGAERGSAPTRLMRASTRITFPSTTASLWPQAMEAMAALVYAPTPAEHTEWVLRCL